MKVGMLKGFLWVMGIGLITSLGASEAPGQILPKNRDRAKAAPQEVAPQPVAPAPGEIPAETRREGREEARETREAAREAGAPRAEAREAARETRRETRQNVRASRAADYGVWFARGNQGLVIDDVSNNGVFWTAGIRAGDQIVSINGEPVRSEAQFVQVLSGDFGTREVVIIVLRDGREQRIVLQPAALSAGVVTYDPFYRYGLIIDDTRPNQIVVQRVYPRTPAYYAGFRAGDVITTYGGQRVTSVDAFSRSLADADGALDFTVMRDGRSRDIQVDALVDTDRSRRSGERASVDVDVNDRATDTRRGSAEATVRDRSPEAAPRRRTDADADAAPRRDIDSDAPRTAPRETRGSDVDRPRPPSGTTPATPATPATPGTRATPATPATPAPRASDDVPPPRAPASGKASGSADVKSDSAPKNSPRLFALASDQISTRRSVLYRRALWLLFCAKNGQSIPHEAARPR